MLYSTIEQLRQNLDKFETELKNYQTKMNSKQLTEKQTKYSNANSN